MKATIGKTTRTTPDAIGPGHTLVPPTIINKYQKVIMEMDVFYINSVPFFISVGDPVGYITVQALPNEKDGSMRKHMKDVLNIYKKRGLTVEHINANRRFESLKEDSGDHLNICGDEDHGPTINRKI